jgi:predicted glutamine amidotransferase
MCRMVCIVSTDSLTENQINNIWKNLVAMAKDETNTHELNEDKKGEFQHDSGWGLAYYDKSHQLKNHRSMDKIWEDSIPENIFKDLLETNSVMIHVRRGSPGLGLGLEYCHPFLRHEKVVGDIVFAHNGTVQGRLNIKYDPKYDLTVDSDTERFLYSIMTNIENNNEMNSKSISKSLNKTVAELSEYSGANYFCYYKNKFYGSTNFNGDNKKYFTMRYLKAGDHLIISSEAFLANESEWGYISNKRGIEVSLDNINDLVFY